MPSATDHVDYIITQWREQRPDLDTSPMAVIARISRVSRLLEQSIVEVLASFGLNQPGFAVLAALRRAGPPFTLSPTALYNSLLISSGAMTNRLKRLTAAGLVERIPDSRDRRSRLVALTPRGKSIIDEALPAHIENEHRLLAAVSPPRREILAGVLRQVLLQFDDGASTRSR